MRNLFHEPGLLEDVSYERLANPAQGKADYGDSKLDPIDDLIQVAVKFLDDSGADATRFNEFLDPSVADTHQGELRCRKKRIGRDQEQNQENPEQHKSDHGCSILTFQRLYRIFTSGSETVELKQDLSSSIVNDGHNRAETLLLPFSGWSSLSSVPRGGSYFPWSESLGNKAMFTCVRQVWPEFFGFNQEAM